MNPVNSVLCYFIYVKIFTCPNSHLLKKFMINSLLKWSLGKTVLIKKTAPFMLYIIFGVQLS